MIKPLLIEIAVEELPAIPFLKELPNIEKKWSEIINKYKNREVNKALFSIEEDKHIKKIHANLKCCGLKSTHLLSTNHFNKILQFGLLNLNLIILWTTEKEGCFKWAEGVKLSNLYDEFHSQENFTTNPINLMWDDPTTYYYPNEN